MNEDSLASWKVIIAMEEELIEQVLFLNLPIDLYKIVQKYNLLNEEWLYVVLVYHGLFLHILAIESFKTPGGFKELPILR